MIRSFMRISAVDLGFDPDGLLTMDVLPLDRNPGAHKEYYSALVQRLRTVPGIASVGLVDNFPLGASTSFSSVVVEGKTTFATVFEVLPGYFETIGATLVAGRLPTDADYSSGYHGVVLNASAARTLFPDGPAVGRSITSGRPATSWDVFGVIADLRHGGPLPGPDVPSAQVFFPLAPTESDLKSAMTVVVRPSGAVPGLGDRLRQTAQSIGPRVRSSGSFGERLPGDSVITPRRRGAARLLGALGQRSRWWAYSG